MKFDKHCSIFFAIASVANELSLSVITEWRKRIKETRKKINNIGINKFTFCIQYLTYFFCADEYKHVTLIRLHWECILYVHTAVISWIIQMIFLFPLRLLPDDVDNKKWIKMKVKWRYGSDWMDAVLTFKDKNFWRRCFCWMVNFSAA